MNTLSILNEARLIQNEFGEITSIAISLNAYDYLCVAAGKNNIFASSDFALLEMDESLFLDLMTKAYMFESEIYNMNFNNIFRVTYREFIGNERNFFYSYFKSFGLDLNNLERENVEFVNVFLNDNDKKVFLVFENNEHSPLTSKIQDDWYAIKETHFSEVV